MNNGHNLRGILNDLKRRPIDAAAELGVGIDVINDCIRGKTEITPDLIKRAMDLWPVNWADFYSIEDDAPNGVKIMTCDESAKSSRVMHRAGAAYYEYRDTAMSKVSQFRPEWIKELCVVQDNNPNNEAVQWNNGHFMHQFTYFLGPVNFYFKGDDGSKKVAVMDTGDTMYITPFVPHTFTTRANKEGKHGLILALTYGNKLAGESQKELAALGDEIGAQYALDYSTEAKMCGSNISFFRDATSMSSRELAQRSGIKQNELNAYEQGSVLPAVDDLEKIAGALSINIRDIIPTKPDAKVVVKKYKDNARWLFPEDNSRYEMVELATTNNLPYSKSLEVNVLTYVRAGLDLKCGLHQFGYNQGDKAIQMHWQALDTNYSTTVAPGDSFYMKPFIPHSYSSKGGQLLVLRIGGRVAGESARELSVIGRENAQRAIRETLSWFDEKGKSNV